MGVFVENLPDHGMFSSEITAISEQYLQFPSYQRFFGAEYMLTEEQR
jgi:hypothetical protein